MPGTPATAAYCWSICQTTFSPNRSPATRSARFTGLKMYPSATPAADVHASIATLTHVGIGAVRTRPCFPRRSTMHQRPSRSWTCSNVSAATSDRLRPHPRRTARMARSRRPFTVLTSGALSRLCAWRTDSQLPTRMPTDFRAPHTGDSRRKFRREESVVGCLSRQFANRRHPNDDRRRAKATGLQ